jgi:hypothetical protein
LSKHEFVQRWCTYQVKTNQAPGFPLRTGMNGLEVNHRLGGKLAAKMAAEGFVAPELNPNTANAAQAEGGGGKVIEEVDGVFHVTMGRVMALRARLIAYLTDQWKQQVL